MSSFDEELARQLETIRGQNLFRSLRRVDSPQSARLQLDTGTYLNFSSNDYLGLANHPALKEAAIKAVESFGAGSGASRLICGSLGPFHQLEEALAEFKNAEAALSFSTGYATALGTICALVGKDDVLVLDKLVHASIVDAARLSGAKLRVFAHNDLNDLEEILKWCRSRAAAKSRILVVTESLFSMDGDAAPLREIVELKNRSGAWLMVDEAHATGLFGKNRRGLAEELGVSGEVEIQMGTLGKALGAAGGFICGSRRLVDLLVNCARSFIFSTAPVPAAAAAAAAGIGIVKSARGETLRQDLFERVRELHSKLKLPRAGSRQSGLPWETQIIPFILGDESRTLEAAARLRQEGIFVPAIRYPTVARGAARLRITLTAAHSSDDVGTLAAALERLPAPKP